MATRKIKTAYVVQPYWRDGRHLREGVPKRMDSEVMARSVAQQLAATKPAVAVIAFEYDEAVDYIGETRIIARHGAVPDNDGAGF